MSIRVDSKLIFALCFTCANEKKSLICKHACEEREISGTWTSVEIMKAIEKGYQIIKIFEIYNYKKKEKLFGDYVNTFLKIKQESDGIPPSCYSDDGVIDEEKVSEYITSYYNHEGILLDREKIEKTLGVEL